MPLLLDPLRSKTEAAASAGAIRIAVLNNLSDAGLESGERQIIDLLSQIADSHVIHLRFFSLPQIARGAEAKARIEERYADFAHLMRSRVDGLIVTGCEPLARRLPDEAFWLGLTAVIDWAEHNTRSSVWSCLAAHAAVLHLDGIERRPLARKCTGVFSVKPMQEHPLLAGTDGPWPVIHSRWNDLAEADLVAGGYQILTQGDAVGVDTFVKQWRSLFVYLQGHPEYDADAIRREYRRDVMRFLEGTTGTYPSLPLNYFSRETEAQLQHFEVRAREGHEPDLPSVFPTTCTDLAPQHRNFALMLFRNWLGHLHRTAPQRAA